jgi:hypothetical protein
MIPPFMDYLYSNSGWLASVRKPRGKVAGREFVSAFMYD